VAFPDHQLDAAHARLAGERERMLQRRHRTGRGAISTVNGDVTKVQRDIQALQADGACPPGSVTGLIPGAQSAFDSAVSQANADIAAVSAD
jgi:hypothetical protein